MNASCSSGRRSQRSGRRRKTCSHAKVRSTIQRSLPRPEPFGVATRDDGLDAALPQLAVVLVVVIAAVGNELLGALVGAAGLATDGTDAVDERQQLRDVVAMSAGQRDADRDASGVADQVVFGARAAAVNRRRPGQGPFKSTYVAGVGDRRGPADRARRVEALKHRLVRALPHAGLLPVTQAPPRGH